MQSLLCAHVHVCLVGGKYVLFDERASRFKTLGAEASALATWIQGWPRGGSPAHSLETAEHSTPPALLQRCLQEGWITKDPTHGKLATPASVRVPTQSVNHSLFARPTLRGYIAFSMARAACYWAVAHRVRSLESTFERLSRRAERIDTVPNPTEAQLLSLVRAFHNARPFFYELANRCLLDSLLLADLLLAHQFHCTLCIGVRLNPFFSHAWVQTTDFVLNDTPDFVSSLTPVKVLQL